MEQITIGETYQFHRLEKYLNEENAIGRVALIVRNISQSCDAMMHRLGTGLSDAWKEGDCMLFYADGETHGANSYDEFKVLQMIIY